MTLLNLSKWSSSSTKEARPGPPARLGNNSTARRPPPSTSSNNAAGQQRDLRGLVSRWRSTANGSGCKPTRPRPRRRTGATAPHLSMEPAAAVLIERNIDNTVRVPAVVQGTDTRHMPPTTLAQVPALHLKRQRQGPPCAPSFHGIVERDITLAATARDTRQSAVAGVDLRLLLNGQSIPVGLPRSGLAASSWSMTATSSPSAVFHVDHVVDTRLAPVAGERTSTTCAQPAPSPTITRTAQSCWGEKRDTIVPSVAVTPKKEDAVKTKTADGQSPQITVAELGRKQAVPCQGDECTSNTARGRGDRPPITSLPMLSPEYAGSGRGLGQCNQRPDLLHRRKSEPVAGVRGKSRTRTSSVSVGPARQGIGKGVLQNNKEVCRPSSQRMEGGRTPCGVILSNGGNADLGTDQGQQKAQMRVMEWKRRRAEELNTQEQELAPFEQQSRVEAFEAARKLAAARAEETERRAVEERENTAEIARASEMAERWAKNSRERERRRAEIYAINAVMRDAFDRDFKAFSLEKARQAAVAPLLPEDPLPSQDKNEDDNPAK